MTIHHLPPQPNVFDSMKGPERSGQSVIIDGRAVPNLHMRENGEEVIFVLDERLAFGFPREWAFLAAAFAANAMAIGAGYSHVCGETKDRSFAPRCGPIESEQGEG